MSEAIRHIAVPVLGVRQEARDEPSRPQDENTTSTQPASCQAVQACLWCAGEMPRGAAQRRCCSKDCAWNRSRDMNRRAYLRRTGRPADYDERTDSTLLTRCICGALLWREAPAAGLGASVTDHRCTDGREVGASPLRSSMAMLEAR